jgi:hypothetical protein
MKDIRPDLLAVRRGIGIIAREHSLQLFRVDFNCRGGVVVKMDK